MEPAAACGADWFTLGLSFGVEPGWSHKGTTPLHTGVFHLELAWIDLNSGNQVVLESELWHTATIKKNGTLPLSSVSIFLMAKLARFALVTSYNLGRVTQICQVAWKHSILGPQAALGTSRFSHSQPCYVLVLFFSFIPVDSAFACACANGAGTTRDPIH